MELIKSFILKLFSIRLRFEHDSNGLKVNYFIEGEATMGLRKEEVNGVG